MAGRQQGTFAGDYRLTHQRGWPAGIFLYSPVAADPFCFVRPNGATICLNEEFITDLASTPRIVWPVHGLAPADMEQPSLVHDWLYTVHHEARDIYGFGESNLVLQEACLSADYSRPMAWACRRACDLFGKGIWDHGSGNHEKKVEIRNRCAGWLHSAWRNKVSLN